MAISKKVCILGDFGVGKSSLVRRYVLNEFSPEYQTTLGVNVYKYTDEIESGDGAPVAVNQILWDLEGSIHTPQLLEGYMRGSSGALVVGDIMRDDPLGPMTTVASQFQRVQPGRPVVFALNKIDLLVDADDGVSGDALAQQFGTIVERTSAATGVAVAQLFRTLAQRILMVGA